MQDENTSEKTTSAKVSEEIEALRKASESEQQESMQKMKTLQEEKDSLRAFSVVKGTISKDIISGTSSEWDGNELTRTAKKWKKKCAKFYGNLLRNE